MIHIIRVSSNYINISHIYFINLHLSIFNARSFFFFENYYTIPKKSRNDNEKKKN